jgi:hypothetical protein
LSHLLTPFLEYKHLETQVEALKTAHLMVLKYVALPFPAAFSGFPDTAAHRITKAYETETYDYPSQVQETVTELGANIGRGVTNFAASNLKGTNLPAPSPAAAPVPQHKTLPHALSRAANSAASTLGQVPGGHDDRLGHALGVYGGAWEKIAGARVQHDDRVVRNFLQPWQQTLQAQINVAVKARQAVRVSRLELDAAKQAYVFLSIFIAPVT